MLYYLKTDVKSLVYSELNFVSTAFPRQGTEQLVELIFDEVAREMYELFVGEPVTTITAPSFRKEATQQHN